MQFYANLIYENSDNQRVRFSSIGKMLNLKADTKLPSPRNERDLANSFVDFFIDKVQRIRMRLLFATSLLMLKHQSWVFPDFCTGTLWLLTDISK